MPDAARLRRAPPSPPPAPPDTGVEVWLADACVTRIEPGHGAQSLVARFAAMPSLRSTTQHWLRRVLHGSADDRVSLTGSLRALLNFALGTERAYGTPGYYQINRASALIRRDAEVLPAFGVRLEGEVITLIAPEENR